MLSMRILTPEDWRAWRELRLLALEEAPYAFSSTIEEWQGAGDSELLRCRLMRHRVDSIYAA